MPIFFVLSGFLLFGPWVRAAADGSPAPSVRRYAWHRVRRIMPAYVVTVLAAYLIYHFRTAGPNPGHTWIGSVPQPDVDADLHRQLPVSPICTRALRRCGASPSRWRSTWRCRRWRTCCWWCCAAGSGGRCCCSVGLAGAGARSRPAWLMLVHTTDFLPDGARLWLPTYLAWFLGGMMLAVLQAMGVRGYALVCVPLAVVCYFIASTPIAGEPTTSPARTARGLGQGRCSTRSSRRWLVAPLALGDQRLVRPVAWPAGRWCSSARSPTRSS